MPGSWPGIGPSNCLPNISGTTVLCVATSRSSSTADHSTPINRICLTAGFARFRRG